MLNIANSPNPLIDKMRFIIAITSIFFIQL